MLDNNDPIFEKWQRTMDFILEQQAQSVVRIGQAEERQAKAEERQAKAEERQAASEERFNQRMAAIDRRLSRAIRLGVREARNERVRRQEMDARLEEGLRKLEAQIDRFIESLHRGGNGSN